MNVFIDEIAKQALALCNKLEIRHPSHREMFVSGYREGLRFNPWHKASEELPNEEGTYLLRFWAGSSFQIFIGSYRNGKFDALTMEDGDYVTHWMPIPEIKETPEAMPKFEICRVPGKRAR